MLRSKRKQTTVAEANLLLEGCYAVYIHIYLCKKRKCLQLLVQNKELTKELINQLTYMLMTMIAG